jgi:hypothetical protein
MEKSRSIRFSNRARTTERGFALLVALVVAVLYLSLIQLMLWEGARDLEQARRYRARVVAATLAENAAELGAQNIVLVSPAGKVQLTDDQGEMHAEPKRNSDGSFAIHAWGRTSGVVEQRAEVVVIGAVVGENLRIDYTLHDPQGTGVPVPPVKPPIKLPPSAQ